jgi:hypothetical protein
MNDSDLGPMPEPMTEDPEIIPGGTDALEGDPADSGLARDLDPDDNPAVDDVLPDQISEPDDKSQAPEGEADQESGTVREGAASSSGEPSGEPSAGQEAEDGSVEPPA